MSIDEGQVVEVGTSDHVQPSIFVLLSTFGADNCLFDDDVVIDVEISFRLFVFALFRCHCNS